LSDKILVNGCGYTFSKQSRKTWTNILSVAGANIIDISKPAISNQWIINKTFLELCNNTNIKSVIVQLTSLGKFDVEVDLERINNLVKPDPIRNFVISYDNSICSHDQLPTAGIWPSSGSQDHESKKQYMKWLYSPGLETEDLFCKVIMLASYCQTKKIKLYVYQAYDIIWSESQKKQLTNIIQNINESFNHQYKKSLYYKDHDFSNANTVPNLKFQLEIASIIVKNLDATVQKKLEKIKNAYDRYK
jgi:hypothetical protein